MPNSRRLALLIELREATGLSQAEMERCGLKGRQSRKSVANWETGESTPRRHHRRRFIAYLLDDLGLENEPKRFEQVWAMLVEEWNWEPLDGQEMARLLGDAVLYHLCIHQLWKQFLQSQWKHRAPSPCRRLPTNLKGRRSEMQFKDGGQVVAFGPRRHSWLLSWS